jgi:hypothetical protein|tara:strand:- start:322 stop:537 length:216 start_codon:yes stop_codon:yes gene_type:complete
MTKQLLTERFQELAGIKSLSEEETSRPFVLDSRTIENLKHLTNFRGDEKIEELTGLANYILDTPSPSFEKK